MKKYFFLIPKIQFIGLTAYPNTQSTFGMNILHCVSHTFENMLSKTVLSFYHRFTLFSVSRRSARRTTASRYMCHHVHSQTLCSLPRGSRVACLCLVCLSESQTTANFFFKKNKCIEVTLVCNII